MMIHFNKVIPKLETSQKKNNLPQPTSIRKGALQTGNYHEQLAAWQVSAIYD